MSRIISRLVWAAVIAMLPVLPADALATSGPAAVADIESLEPGDYFWEPERAEEGPVRIVIGLKEQRAYVFRAGTLIGASTISSGKEGHGSPWGRFQILEKRRMHRSNRYSDAPMPFMQRLNWFGVALHGGHVPGYPASHGCIRLPMGFARKLFEATEVGSAVYVTPDPVASPREALEVASLLADQPVRPDRLPRDETETIGTQ